MHAVYRGKSVDAFNAMEFRTGMIGSETYPVWFAEMTEDEIEKRRETDEGDAVVPEAGTYWRAKSVDRLDDYLVDYEEVEIAGGLTSNLGTAKHFSFAGNKGLKLVMILDGDRIGDDVMDVEYTPEFVDDHPGIAARVNTHLKGEVFVNGKFWGLTGENHDGDPYIQWWGEDAREEIVSPIYAEEEEAVCFCEGIDIRGNVEALVGYYETGRHVHSQYSSLLELPWVHDRSMGRDVPDDEHVLSGTDERERTELLYEETAGIMDWPDDNLWIAVLDHVQEGRGRGHILSENFEWAYNGETFYEDYNAVRALVSRGHALPGGGL